MRWQLDAGNFGSGDALGKKPGYLDHHVVDVARIVLHRCPGRPCMCIRQTPGWHSTRRPVPAHPARVAH
jgi:hypothetical protein